MIPKITELQLPMECRRIFDREETNNYLELEITHGSGSGGRGIVGDSFFRSLGKEVDKLDDEDIDICLQMAILVNSLSTRQNTLFARFLSIMYLNKADNISTQQIKLWDMKEKKWCCPNCVYKRCNNKAFNKPEAFGTLPVLPPIPKSVNSICSVILNGSNSLISKLPIPVIRALNGHAYVLPSECFKLFLANGHRPVVFDKTEVDSAPNETPRRIEIARHLKNTIGHKHIPHVPFSFIEWKDNCEASKSNKKSKYGSLWIWSMIIITNCKSDSPEATFPIAIGYKSKINRLLFYWLSLLSLEVKGRLTMTALQRSAKYD
jgi:hypothetical protein